MKCQYCNQEIQNTDIFCPNCGQKIVYCENNLTTENTSLKDTHKKRHISDKNKKIIIAISILILLSITLITGVFLYIHNADNNFAKFTTVWTDVPTITGV